MSQGLDFVAAASKDAHSHTCTRQRLRVMQKSPAHVMERRILYKAGYHSDLKSAPYQSKPRAFRILMFRGSNVVAQPWFRENVASRMKESRKESPSGQNSLS